MDHHLLTPTLSADIVNACEILWRFNTISKSINSPEVILLLGSNDINVAKFAVEISKKEKYAKIICSGGLAHTDDLLATHWEMTEAEKFADILVQEGIQSKRIVTEPMSKNTSENLIFSKKIITNLWPFAKKILLIHKPFMTLRAYLTGKKVLRTYELGIIHEDISCAKYIDRYKDISIIDILVGDTERIIAYPRLSYFEPITIPESVTKAMNYLKEKGFTHHSLNF
uniref:DUF218 domain-containing protein n=1 Tax=Desulfovibrio sp. U5L TaxID=596152 RepID=I2Q6I7_9BACT